jgi:hypothetical protein
LVVACSRVRCALVVRTRAHKGCYVIKGTVRLAWIMFRNRRYGARIKLLRDQGYGAIHFSCVLVDP